MLQVCMYQHHARCKNFDKFLPLAVPRWGVKGKGKGHPTTGHEGPEGEWRYSSTLVLTSALDGVGGQGHDPAALPPGKEPIPVVQEAGGAPGLVRKISSPYRDSIPGPSSQ